jgi:aspartyl-tRNA(Asn)/glutamyl-tRNA(Gln) amidotransferase subunit B
MREDDVQVLVGDKISLELLLEAVKLGGAIRECANLVLNEYRPRISDKPGAITSQHIADLAIARCSGKLTSVQIRAVFAVCFDSGTPVGEAVLNLGFDQHVDGSDLAQACASVISANEKVVADIRKGKTAALQVLVGQVMKESGGKAKPDEALAELKKQLGL